MDNIEIGKYGRSFGLSFAITSLFSALLVVLKETNQQTILAWMKAASPHHWITHALLDLIIFVVLGVVLAKANDGLGIKISADKLNTYIVGSFVIGGLIIAGFFLIFGWALKRRLRDFNRLAWKAPSAASGLSSKKPSGFYKGIFMLFSDFKDWFCPP
jgi:hypothetical protein